MVIENVFISSFKTYIKSSYTGYLKMVLTNFQGWSRVQAISYVLSFAYFIKGLKKKIKNEKFEEANLLS